jgi:excisionase family DNA binding protein
MSLPMSHYQEAKKPTKKERQLAMQSYDTLVSAIAQITEEDPEIEIEETKERIKIPLHALKLLAKILKATAEGKPVSIVPQATEMTTQSAAELLGCSRPHLVKLVESGKIPFTTIGRHRRIKFEDIVAHKKAMKEKQEKLLIEMMKSDEEAGLYDS